MDIEPEIAGFFSRVKEALSDHPYFQPTDDEDKGKPKALKKCQASIDVLIKGGLIDLPQASLEFLLRICQGKEDIPGIKTPVTRLKTIADQITTVLEIKFYNKNLDSDKDHVLFDQPTIQIPQVLR